MRAAKKRLSEINQQLAGSLHQFSQNVLADETDQLLVIENEAIWPACRNRCATPRPAPPNAKNTRASG